MTIPNRPDLAAGDSTAGQSPDLGLAMRPQTGMSGWSYALVSRTSPRLCPVAVRTTTPAGLRCDVCSADGPWSPLWSSPPWA